MATEQQLLVQRIPTRAPADGEELVDFWCAQDYDYTDTTATLVIEATATSPLVVLEVVNLVRTAFAGTSPTIDVGNGTTADLWIDNVEVTEDSLGNLINSHWSTSASGGGGATHGIRYVAPTTVVVTIGGTDLTAGEGTVFVHCLRYTL